jgi:hypothetical protein
MPSSATLKGAFTFTAALDEKGEIQWNVNRRPVPFQGGAGPFQGAAGIKRVKEAGPQKGSVSFLTSGRTVLLSGLRIAGQLDPGWLPARARRIAEEELAKVEGKPAAELPAGSAARTPGREDGGGW